MLEGTWAVDDVSAGDAVVFLAAGEQTKGEYRCSACSYGVVVCATLPVCPMCGGETWEETTWSPFARAAAP